MSKFCKACFSVFLYANCVFANGMNDNTVLVFNQPTATAVKDVLSELVALETSARPLKNFFILDSTNISNLVKPRILGLTQVDYLLGQDTAFNTSYINAVSLCVSSSLLQGEMYGAHKFQY